MEVFCKAALGVCGWCEGCTFKASCTMLVTVCTVRAQTLQHERQGRTLDYSPIEWT